jgi:hypothetical protein
MVAIAKMARLLYSEESWKTNDTCGQCDVILIAGLGTSTIRLQASMGTRDEQLISCLSRDAVPISGLNTSDLSFGASYILTPSSKSRKSGYIDREIS